MNRFERFLDWCYEHVGVVIVVVGGIFFFGLLAAALLIDRPQVVVVDGCEYISHGNGLTHKANCTNSFHLR